MSTMKSKRRPEEGADPGPRRDAEAVVDRLAGLLPEEALRDALKGLEPEEITGPGGLLVRAGRPRDRDRAGGRADRASRPSAGRRARQRERPQRVDGQDGADRPGAGRRSSTPRDRDGSFEPQLVAKRQTRLAGLDDKILGLYAGGMTVRDISAHLSELYGVADRPRHDQPDHRRRPRRRRAWRTRPLDAGLSDRLLRRDEVKVREDRSVRNRACYLALGVTCDGEREVLGIWWQETEGSKFWLAVLNDLQAAAASRTS